MTEANRLKILNLKKLISNVRQYGALDLEEGLDRLEEAINNMDTLNEKVPEERISDVLDSTEIVAVELLKQAKRIHTYAKQQRLDNRLK